ncbi:hypothetical protein CPC08DRAFT_609027, partial [Agrocybe pediades]
TTTPLMPLKGDRGAPTFDPKHPSEIKRYFAELEFLFSRSNIVLSFEKKQFTTRYLDYTTAELWEAIPEYASLTATFDDFKKAVIESYTDQARKYSVSDLDLLIGERQRLGIRDLHDLTDYHLRFQAISTHLIANKRIGDVDQYNAYLRGF